jgi:plasmid stability protein
MSSITIRNLDPAFKERLRVRAAQRGHSMEAEADRDPPRFE